jgi:four helix bundle protein
MSHDRRRNHKDLILWQKAMTLTADVHRLTVRLPRHEIFGLTSQIRRAAVSIPSNVAEGAARRTTREFIAFVHIARGSFAELETQLLLARQIGYLADRDLAPVLVRLDEVGRLLNAVISGLKARAERASSLPPTP